MRWGQGCRAFSTSPAPTPWHWLPFTHGFCGVGGVGLIQHEACTAALAASSVSLPLCCLGLPCTACHVGGQLGGHSNQHLLPAHCGALHLGDHWRCGFSAPYPVFAAHLQKMQPPALSVQVASLLRTSQSALDPSCGQAALSGRVLKAPAEGPWDPPNLMLYKPMPLSNPTPEQVSSGQLLVLLNSLISAHHSIACSSFPRGTTPNASYRLTGALSGSLCKCPAHPAIHCCTGMTQSQ